MLTNKEKPIIINKINQIYHHVKCAEKAFAAQGVKLSGIRDYGY